MKKGFTLIELLVVVTIIAILAFIGIPQYNLTIEKAKAAEVLKLSRDIYDSAERYAFRNNLSSAQATDISLLDITTAGDITKTTNLNDTLTNYAGYVGSSTTRVVNSVYKLLPATVEGTRTSGFGTYKIVIPRPGSGAANVGAVQCWAQTGTDAKKICMGLGESRLPTTTNGSFTVFYL
ncbi:PilE-like protein [Elusimicrobium minutum Pei191]|uniref:PilE-like protein n=1 Tax=Elusimicrobium minutum (strain Pei191) TaxID=445932 RepID=B2KE34_ELUMP|nr:prepilin-type N-terminal cleavage/methylation domain-containing protein [Elusimicrobium minutum]ACC98780.1 PilE-like protein [Elusimicrobium minutum Pei191]